MAARFLRSKITPPSLHHEAVGRSRLADLVVRATGPLVLISAPAGYGKTTLLVQSLADHPATVAWVTVDAADNDPVRFWSHVAAALVDDPQRLDALANDLAAGEAERQTVIDELVASVESTAGQVVLVLDDLHEIVAEEILDALGRVLTSPPDNLQVVASTRSDPALPTARLRAQGRLTEIRADDLAFTPREAALVFRGNANDADLHAIIERTEGWPTAVRLLEVASGSSRTGQELLEAVAHGSPDLADFLSAEALEVQRTEVQQFLLETAILDDVTPVVCDTVIGRPGSLSLLRELAANQVFTTLVEPASNTYRYHHLFRDFLRGRAQELPEQRRHELAQRAADFYAEEGQATEAIRLALAAGNDAMAVELILQFNMPFAQAGLMATVFEWLNMYGLDRVGEQAELSLLMAWAMLNLRRYGEIDSALAAPALADERTTSRYGPLGPQIHAVRSHWYRHVGDVARAQTAAEQGALLDPDEMSIASCVVGVARGIAKLLQGIDATSDFERAVTVGLSHKIDSSAMMGYTGLAVQASRDPDRLSEAVALADQALAFCTTRALTNFHQPALPYVVKARASRSEGRVGDAARYATRAVQIATEGHEPLAAVLGHTELARVAHLQGDADGSRSALRHAQSLLTPNSGDFLHQLVRTARNDTRFVTLEGRDDLPLGADDLTDREMGVLRLLPHGLSRRELAEQLYISENTVKTHLTSIRHKLGVSGRADIAARAAELGII